MFRATYKFIPNPKEETLDEFNEKIVSFARKIIPLKVIDTSQRGKWIDGIYHFSPTYDDCYCGLFYAIAFYQICNPDDRNDSVLNGEYDVSDSYSPDMGRLAAAYLGYFNIFHEDPGYVVDVSEMIKQGYLDENGEPTFKVNE